MPKMVRIYIENKQKWIHRHCANCNTYSSMKKINMKYYIKRLK